MSGVRPRSVIAVLGSDLHLSDRPPSARAENKEEWYGCMGDLIQALCTVCRDEQSPLVLAGDLFHSWDAPAVLINFAIREFRPFPHAIYAVPGQHDLPYHNHNLLGKSAYWTLVEAGVVQELIPGLATRVLLDTESCLEMWGVPWGVRHDDAFRPRDRGGKEATVVLAVVHKYVWRKGNQHPGAKAEDHVREFAKQYAWADAVVVGDNHDGFTTTVNGVRVHNNGGLMRRRSDERDYPPCYGLLYSDGSVERVPLDCSRDKFHENYTDPPVGDETEREEQLARLLGKLSDLGDKALDFAAALKSSLPTLESPVRGIILEALESAQKEQR